MGERFISWRKVKGVTVAGIEDTGNGWAVVDSEGRRLVEVGDYSRKSREYIEARYEEHIERAENGVH